MTSISINRQDGLSSATSWKGPVRVATTNNIQLSDLQVIDGVMLAAGDRVLVKDQTDARYNGIWVVDTGLWRRARDFASNRDVREGTQVFVVEGATYNRSGWYVSSDNPIQIGTTDIQFTQNMLINTEQLEQLVQQAEAARDAAQAAEDAANSVLDSMLERSVGSFASDALADQFLVDNGLSKFPGTIYFNTTGSVWKYWDGSAWLSFPYATIADGSVTDAKLPDYDPSTSPSSAKLRYLASSSVGAMAGAIQRPVQLKLSERLDAADFGVKADGTTNDTVAMSAALRAAELYGRPLFLPSGTILVDADALFIGNGAEGTNSSYNNQTIIGIGSSPAFASGTIIKSRTSGTCLFDIRGLVSGVSISGVTFDCDSKVQIGIRIRSMSESNIEQFAVRNFTSIGVDWNCRANPSGSPTWSSGNVIKQFYITSSSVVAFGVGLLLDGQISTNKDPHRNTFHTGIIQINKAAANPTFAMLLAMTDSNTFIEVDADTIGTGLGFGVRFSALTSNGFPFPQNNFFYGCSIKGIDVAEDAGTGKLIGQNMFVNMTTMDGETLPTHPKLLGFTDTGKFFNDIVVDKNVPSFELRSRDGLKRYRLINNSNDSTDGGVLLQKWSTSTSAWVTYFAVDSAGTPSITLPGMGLKQVQAGAVDTGGTGFRRLVVAN